MADVVNVHDLKTNYSKYLEKVIGGQEILLGKHGRVIAKIVPLPQAQQPRIPGALKGKIWLDESFDEPLLSLWDTNNSK